MVEVEDGSIEHLAEWRQQIIRDSKKVMSVLGDNPVPASSLLDQLSENGMFENDARTAVWFLISEGDVDFDWQGNIFKVPEGESRDLFEPDAI